MTEPKPAKLPPIRYKTDVEKLKSHPLGGLCSTAGNSRSNTPNASHHTRTIGMATRSPDAYFISSLIAPSHQPSAYHPLSQRVHPMIDGKVLLVRSEAMAASIEVM